jgi:hypothetical protein
VIITQEILSISEISINGEILKTIFYGEEKNSKFIYVLSLKIDNFQLFFVIVHEKNQVVLVNFFVNVNFKTRIMY